ncbi:MAG: hypothetical protein ACXWDL_15850 [Nocardioides sp.]
MARQVFLHVGTPKSGTTFLQSLWWHHRTTLGERGLLLPGAAIVDHFHASALVCGRREVVDRLGPSQLRTWDDLLAEIDAWDGAALVSHELFAPASALQAADALAALARVAREVHVVVTSRDLARQLPSGWQQNVKQGRTDTLREFWERARDNPDDAFWTFQDVPSLLDRWTSGVPADRRHLVVLPQPGAPRDLLWLRVCELLGVDPTGLSLDIERANESLGLAEVEVMRRVHLAVPEERRGLDVRRIATNWLTQQVLVPAGTGEPFVLPDDLHAWALARGSAMVAELSTRELHVVGDLADLVPQPTPPPGRTPDDVTDSDVAAVAVPAMTRMLLAELDRRQRRER